MTANTIVLAVELTPNMAKTSTLMIAQVDAIELNTPNLSASKLGTVRPTMDEPFKMAI